MGKAVAALEKCATGFLQSSAVPLLRKIPFDMDLNPGNRDAPSASLSVGDNQEFSPTSGEIEADLADATAKEKELIKSFEIMSAAKAKRYRHSPRD